MPDDTNGVIDVFVRDVAAGTTKRVSISTGGVQADARCDFQRISSDGRYVAFMSIASTLVPGDTNGWSDIFLHDLATGITTRESVGSGGTQGNLHSETPSLSADGRYVAFWSNSSNLVPGDTNGVSDIFLRDRLTSTTTRLTTLPGGVQANNGSAHPFISADAGRIAFVSAATNLIADDGNGFADIYTRTLPTGPFFRVGVLGGPEPNGESRRPSLSADGRYVACESDASNLVPGDTSGFTDIFAQDLVTFALERVSVATGGAQGNGRSFNPWISESGRFITFESEATNLVPNDTNGWQDIFVHDRLTGETRRISENLAGTQGDSLSFYPAPSADGSAIAFGSFSSNLVPGDTNFSADVFVRTTPPEPVAYCLGGPGFCPCGNADGSDRGCRNSTGVGGLLS